jgi:hypothetical protein
VVRGNIILHFTLCSTDPVLASQNWGSHTWEKPGREKADSPALLYPTWRRIPICCLKLDSSRTPNPMPSCECMVCQFSARKNALLRFCCSVGFGVSWYRIALTVIVSSLLRIQYTSQRDDDRAGMTSQSHSRAALHGRQASSSLDPDRRRGRRRSSRDGGDVM